MGCQKHPTGLPVVQLLLKCLKKTMLNALLLADAPCNAKTAGPMNGAYSQQPLWLPNGIANSQHTILPLIRLSQDTPHVPSSGCCCCNGRICKCQRHHLAITGSQALQQGTEVAMQPLTPKEALCIQHCLYTSSHSAVPKFPYVLQPPYSHTHHTAHVTSPAYKLNTLSLVVTILITD